MPQKTEPRYFIRTITGRFFGKLKEAGRDLLPIILVIVFFQLAILRQPFPDLLEVLMGTTLVVIGLMLFVQGLEMGLFPIGENLAVAFAQKGSLVWLLLFGFGLGFSTTVAEPALIAITQEAAKVAAQADIIAPGANDRAYYALGLRFTVAVSVGLAIAIGIIRILRGWPVHYLIIAGYMIVVLMTLIAPKEIVGIAYDSGGVTTSTITVPLVTALGVGLASSIRGRNHMMDGFGMIAFASLLPVIFVLGFGMIVFGVKVPW
ncbi:hypothetical protein BuS5_01413 [Desulfosarcina sp. BuS5]|uniref:DUF1538 domain-containing protein n=1 Tax=Desulfosarcina sp. BuS5 TaxID=933262 RepID=UPI000A55627F|nr:DUF1538 domain-containing protein [Desulfosarcina sp. BuS5]WDN88445.1 hypothetical protein BuS5_01413 [Desulfosarcina sp. BuS5]